MQWAGTDVGSGVANYTIYVSDNGGPFTAFQTSTSATSAIFAGQLGHTYGFYSIATDQVGNVEGPKSLAETSTLVTTLAPPPSLVSITVTPPNPSIVKGSNEQFTATALYSDNSTLILTNSVTWSSGTATVATINSSGFASSVGTGTSIIQATFGAVSGSTILTVKPLPTAFSGLPASQAIYVGTGSIVLGGTIGSGTSYPHWVRAYRSP